MKFKVLFVVILVAVFAGCSIMNGTSNNKGKEEMKYKVNKSDQEWKEIPTKRIECTFVASPLIYCLPAKTLA